MTPGSSWSDRSGELRDDLPFVYQEVASARGRAAPMRSSPGRTPQPSASGSSYDRALPASFDPAVLVTRFVEDRRRRCVDHCPWARGV